MKPSDLFLFITKCLNMDNHPEWREEIKWMIITEAITWEDFVWTASSHYVLPALYSAFRRNELLPVLPEELNLHLEHIHSLNYARNLQVLDQCKEIGTFLNHKGIEPLFLKGAGFLLSGMYYDLGDRIMEDIDILIPEKDLYKAGEYLSILGYLPGKSQLEDERYQGHHHLPPLVCKGKAAPVEIHRLPVHSGYSDQISVETIFNNRVLSQDTDYWLPSVTDRQLFIFFHEDHSAGGYLSSMPSIKGMYDFALMAKLCPPEFIPGKPGRFRKKFRRFIFITGRYFNSPEKFGRLETPSLERFWKREIFLLNHPGINLFWYDFIYAPAIFLKLLVMAVWSGRNRSLVMKKLRKLKVRFPL